MVRRDDDRSLVARVAMRLHVPIVTDQDFDRLFDALEESAKASAVQIFGLGYGAKIRAREGSLIVTVTVLGAVGATILGTQKFLVDYPKMKDGLAELADDAKRFGSRFRGLFLRDAHAKPDDIEAFEAKPLAPQQVIDFLDDLAKVESQRGQMDPAELDARRQTVLRKLDKVRLLLSAADREGLLKILEQKDLSDLDRYRAVIRGEHEIGQSSAPAMYREFDLLGPDSQATISGPRRRRRSRTKTIYW